MAIRGTVDSETINGTTGNDDIFALDGDDTVFAKDGNDKVYGSTGDDKLLGEAGNDSLFGGEGNDSLNGGSGIDFLTGGLGRDVMTGGTEADTFFYYSLDETGVGAADRDVITDFQVGTDKIHLAGLGVTAANIGFTVTSASTVVNIDVDLEGAADYQIQLNKAVGVTIADFVL